MHDVKGSVVEEPAAKSEKVSIDLIFRPKFFEFVKRSIGFSNSSLDSSSMRSMVKPSMRFSTLLSHCT
jgi:hypothetical protein